jgi:hypothetical protein
MVRPLSQSRIFIMHKRIALVLICVLLCESALWAGLGSDKTMYVGGTVNSIKEGSEGKSSTKDEKVFVFEADGAKLEIPYTQVEGLEYGQKAGRRVGATMALGITTLGIGALPMLFSKKRKHFLTVSWKDSESKPQAIVLELGKDIVRTTLATMEARTGKKIEYQDDDARKSGRGN